MGKGQFQKNVIFDDGVISLIIGEAALIYFIERRLKHIVLRNSSERTYIFAVRLCVLLFLTFTYYFTIFFSYQIISVTFNAKKMSNKLNIV